MRFSGLLQISLAFTTTTLAVPACAADAAATLQGRLTCSAAPAYPPEAMRAHVMGATELELQVAPDGRIVESRVIRPSGNTELHGLLDKTALAGMAGCRVELPAGGPGWSGLRPMRVEYAWRLDYELMSEAQLTTAAEAGDLSAQLQLARNLSLPMPGLDTPANRERATYWFRRAADQGDLAALMRMGSRSRDGIGMPASAASSVEYFRRAGERGEKEAMYYVAMAYSTGKGVPVDVDQALAWHLRAGAAGYPMSLFAAGDLCRQRASGEAEHERALALYLIAQRMVQSMMARTAGYRPGDKPPSPLQREAAIADLSTELGTDSVSRARATAQAWTPDKPLP